MNKVLRRAQVDRRRLLDECEEMLNKADYEGRDLCISEQADFDEKLAKIKQHEADIAREEANSGPRPASDAGIEMDRPLGPEGKDWKPPKEKAKGLPGTLTFRNEASGEIIRSLRPTEPISTAFADEDCPVGHSLHAWLTGSTSKLAAMSYGGSMTDGGFMLDPVLSARVIDLARSASVCQRAGAQTIVMPTNELSLLRVDADPSTYWRAEGVAVLASRPTFGRITLRSKTLACIVPITLELLEDAANAASVIESTIASAIGLAVDRACLAGSGAESEPLGVRNHAGVNAITSVGTPTDYTDPSEAIRDILTANYSGPVSGLKWILHPRDGFSYDGLVAALEGQPQRKTPWISEVEQLYTTSIAIDEGGGDNESYSVLGDFSQMLIGVRPSGVVFRRLNAGTATGTDGKTYNAVTQLLEHLVAHVRIDVALMRPSWFSLMSGITASAE